MNYALITGASGGLGRSFAFALAEKGYSLVLVGRNEDRLNYVKESILTEYPGINVVTETRDLSVEGDCFSLLDSVKELDIEILVNNAGAGLVGRHDGIPLRDELKLIDLNIRAVHILTREMLSIMEKRRRGFILNVSSVGAFFPGPLFSAYYASKAYVYRYTQALQDELRASESDVSVSVLCPGPINTDFNANAGLKRSSGGMDPDYVASYSVKKMLRKNGLIIPDIKSRFGFFFVKIIPDRLFSRFVYRFQKSKINS